VGIAGALSAVAILCVLGRYNSYRRAQLHIAATRVKESSRGATSYRGDRLRCPTTEDLLAGGYVSAGALTDPWGTAIAFHCSDAGEVIVRSAGPDRLFSTADDITEGRS
jgi:hypothetical protein